MQLGQGLAILGGQLGHSLGRRLFIPGQWDISYQAAIQLQDISEVLQVSLQYSL